MWIGLFPERMRDGGNAVAVRRRRAELNIGREGKIVVLQHPTGPTQSYDVHWIYVSMF